MSDFFYNDYLVLLVQEGFRTGARVHGDGALDPATEHIPINANGRREVSERHTGLENAALLLVGTEVG